MEENITKNTYLNRISHMIKNRRQLALVTLFLINLLLFGTVFFLSNKTNKNFSGYVSGIRTKIDAWEEYEKTLLNPTSIAISTSEVEYGFITSSKGSFTDWPEITAKNAMLIDANNKEIIYEKSANDKVPVASLVKIMTAVVALEHADPEDRIVISHQAANTPENFMGISQGEIYTLKDLLFGMMLPSGNDAAEAIANGVAFDRKNFIEWMNIKAGELGLNDTKFVNPSGLNNEGELEYSTAYDLAVLTYYALKTHPTFAEVVSTFAHTIPYSKDHKYLYFENQTNLLTSYPGVKGVKTGYTEEAGLALVNYTANPSTGASTELSRTSSEQAQEIIGVVLGSLDRRGDMTLLLDKAFESYGIEIER